MTFFVRPTNMAVNFLFFLPIFNFAGSKSGGIYLFCGFRSPILLRYILFVLAFFFCEVIVVIVINLQKLWKIDMGKVNDDKWAIYI